MALLKSIPTPFGIPATYWRIIRQNESFDGLTEVYLAGYADQAARQALAAPLEIKHFIFDLRDATRQDAYALIVAPDETNPFADLQEV